MQLQRRLLARMTIQGHPALQQNNALVKFDPFQVVT